MAEIDGWNYSGHPEANKDQRAIVTLEQNGVAWVGIRIWNERDKRWFNGNEPEPATIKAWRILDQPARGFWDRGQLVIPPNNESSQ